MSSRCVNQRVSVSRGSEQERRKDNQDVTDDVIGVVSSDWGQW